MKVGFTGTQAGLTQDQATSLRKLLKRLSRRQGNEWPEFWHGNEKNSDTQAARMAHGLGYTTHAWPGPDPGRSGDFTSTYTHAPQPFLKRNDIIADSCDPIIACPKEEQEIVRSGTWATVRYARGHDKTVYVIQPDGTVDCEYVSRRAGSMVKRHLDKNIRV